jgi:HNH endonuclease
MDEITIARFWSNVDRRGPIPSHCPDLGPCWLWVGGRHYNGYGRFSYDCATRASHRVAFLIEHGHLPMPCALHKCDNRGCCRPSHLVEGTRAENNADMIAKGRDRKARGARSASRLHQKTRPRGPAHAALCAPKNPVRGARHHSAKIVEADVHLIRRLRARGVGPTVIGRRLQITRQMVWLILTGKNWRHVA